MRARLGLPAVVAVVVAAVAVVAAGCTPPSSGGGGPSTAWAVDPAVTGPGISADPLNPHRAYLPTGAPNGRLAVVLHGTGGAPQVHLELMGSLRSAGYHVIGLRYRGALGTLGACPDTVALSDPDCHRSFRSEVVYGEGVADPDGVALDHPSLVVSAEDSVVNRLLRLVQHLTTLAPGAGWEQFQQATAGTCDVVDPAYGACDVRWDRIAAMGFSQGGGVGLYLAKHHALDAVGMLSAPYDGFPDGGGGWTVAPWIAEGGFDVPASRLGALSHTLDARFDLFGVVQDTLGVPGPGVTVTSSTPPYGGSRRLLTSAASTCPWDSVPNHLSTAVDLCTPDGLYAAAWIHLAGG